jgi:hypothetical protein
MRHMVGFAVSRARRGVHDDDVERAQVVADATKLRLHACGRCDAAVPETAEIELVAGVEHQSSGPSSMVIARRPVHGGVEVRGRVEVRAVVGGDAERLDRPAFAARQLLRNEAGEERRH